VSAQGITLEINGELRTVPPPDNLQALLTHLGIEPDRVAVELNRRIVRRGAWASTPVAESDRIEIVQFVGGG
jgi:thiamine biosynthesis protein ThiS